MLYPIELWVQLLIIRRLLAWWTWRIDYLILDFDTARMDPKITSQI